MNRKVQETIEQFDMIKQGDTVIVAVSGGADSVALLDLLCAVYFPAVHVRACHVNHCLRGEESDRDERFVRTMCREYGVPLDVLRVEIGPLARERRQSVELTAREERYAFFSRLSETYGAKIATAHTLSDTAETVLFNMARGTGLEGLCGIPVIRGRIIRPLMACSRQEIEYYCAVHDLYFMTDSSNQSDDFTRNFIRHHVLAQLVEINGGALRSIGRMTELVRSDADYLQQQARAAAQDCAQNGGYAVHALRGLHPAIRSRVIMLLLEHSQVERSAERVGRIDAMLLDPKRHTLSVGGGNYATVRGGVLRIEKREKKQSRTLKPIKCKKTALAGGNIPLESGKKLATQVLNCADYEIFKNNTNMDLKYVADYDKINADILVRSRGEGDLFRPLGRGCTKTLKKLFNELALQNRDQICIVADTSGVLFVEGIGIDERVSPGIETEQVVIFTITEDEHNDTGH